MKHLRTLALCFGAIFITTAVRAQTWTPLTNQPNFGAGVHLLLTDGTVLCQQNDSNYWYKLTPDINGSYVNGTWSQVTPMDSNYGPLYFASAVLADGRVFVMGGEYNFGSAVWNNYGEIYDPVANSWTPLSPPAGWGNIGDAECTVLPNGQLLLADPYGSSIAQFDPGSLSWTAVGTGKADDTDEEGWTLLPDGSVFTVDAWDTPNSERYIPSLGTWITAGNTVGSLVDTNSKEIGPQVLLPNGQVVVFGGTTNNGIYTPDPTGSTPGSWAQVPAFPNGLDVADGPACLLPSGNVLVGASPGVYQIGTSYFEFNGTGLVSVPAPPNGPSDSSYYGNMLMLPTGQVMLTDFSGDCEIYTPAGAPQPGWAPTITSCPTALSGGTTYSIAGTQFNGLSQASVYGDDSTCATNYPLVRITNNASGHVIYCRTHGHSTMAVATGSTPVSTNFDVPLSIESGPSTLQVVTNGIPSASYAVSVGASATITSLSPSTSVLASTNLTVAVKGKGFVNGAVALWNGSSLATSFVNSGKLLATVPASSLQSAAVVPVTVKNADGTISNAENFSVLNPLPTLTGLSQYTVEHGSAGFVLTVTGTNFVSSSVVKFGGKGLTTTFVNGTTLQADVTAAFVRVARTVQITVSSPKPGGGTTAGLNFTTQ
jgi:hypothetical protein